MYDILGYSMLLIVKKRWITPNFMTFLIFAIGHHITAEHIIQKCSMEFYFIETKKKIPMLIRQSSYSIYHLYDICSDVTGLKFSGFGRAGPDPSGFWARSGFLPLGFVSGFSKYINTTLFCIFQ